MAISYLNTVSTYFWLLQGILPFFWNWWNCAAQKHTMSESLNNAWPALNFNQFFSTLIFKSHWPVQASHRIALANIILYLSEYYFIFMRLYSVFRGQRWRSGESTRLPPMWPGFDFQTLCHMWVEFVGSLRCTERFFPGYSGFPLSSKTCLWLNLIWLIWFVHDPTTSDL